MQASDTRLVAAQLSATKKIVVNGEEPIAVKDILLKPHLAATLVSKVCMRVFQGYKEYTSLARDLDYLAHGPEVQVRASAIIKAVIKIVGDRKAGDIIEIKESET